MTEDFPADRTSFDSRALINMAHAIHGAGVHDDKGNKGLGEAELTQVEKGAFVQQRAACWWWSKQRFGGLGKLVLSSRCHFLCAGRPSMHNMKHACCKLAAAFCLVSLLLAGTGAAQDVQLLVRQISGFPLFAMAPPGADGMIYVVSQTGLINVYSTSTGQQLSKFLDITDQIKINGEAGLLGLAFHPRYLENGLFYVNYVDGSLVTNIAEFRGNPDPAVLTADPSTKRVLLTVQQPFSNHNGGMLQFGPDGLLWVGLGDGGSEGDPLKHGQDPSTVFGSIFRLQVDTSIVSKSTNGAVTKEGVPLADVWAKGLRNPWRWSFDGSLLYIADVGQQLYEEVDVQDSNYNVVNGSNVNFGWSILEGNHCVNSASCNTDGLTPPVLEYTHSVPNGCCVIGGFVYRGQAIPQFVGRYFYGDFCSGKVSSFLYVPGQGVTDQQVHGFRNIASISSFGMDSAYELYITAFDEEGSLWKVVPGGGSIAAPTASTPAPSPGSSSAPSPSPPSPAGTPVTVPAAPAPSPGTNDGVTLCCNLPWALLLCAALASVVMTW
eukprot:jgi/Chlat1/6679/Chrsp49S06132